MLFVHVDVVEASSILLATRGDGIDPPEDAVDDVWPAHVVDAQIEPELVAWRTCSITSAA